MSGAAGDSQYTSKWQTASEEIESGSHYLRTENSLRNLARKIWASADELVDTDPIALRELAYEAARALETAAHREDAVRFVLATAERENAPHLYPAAIEDALNF